MWIYQHIERGLNHLLQSGVNHYTLPTMKIIRTSFFVLLILSISVLCSCNSDGLPSFNISNIQGMIPVYEVDLAIGKTEVQAIKATGKIISYNHYLLVSEEGSGIHVIDNSNPKLPINLYFISIKENTDMIIKDNVLYVDNGPDLVGLDFLGDHLQVVSRIENVFLSSGFEKYPAQDNVYYECPDPLKGSVSAWKKGVIENPDCYKRRAL